MWVFSLRSVHSSPANDPGCALQNTVFAVGDPNQAIYSWRGADPTKMASVFNKDFKGALSYLS